MLKWNVEEQKLTKENPDNKSSHIYDIENKMSIEEKKKFLYEKDEEFEYFINLANKFIKEKDTIKKTGDGKYFNTNSLKAWIKKNDTRCLMGDFYNVVGRFYYKGTTFYIESICTDKKYYEDFISCSFHEYLFDLQQKEREYFYAHDEYTILLNKFIDECIIPVNVFDDNIHLSSDGANNVDCVHIFKSHSPNESIYDVPYREATIEELKELIRMNDKLKAYLDKLKSECTIKY